MDMKPANILTKERNNMIDVVFDASCFAYGSPVFIE